MKQRIKNTILVVDDNNTNITILSNLLGKKYDIMIAENGKNAIEIAKKQALDLILLDIMMPDMNGYEVCSILKSQSNTRDIPIIFISAKSDEESIEEGFKVGAIDYITKPFMSLELLARVKTQIKLKCLVDNLEYIASHDEMTGVYNRRKFFQEATKSFKKLKNNLYAIMIDIDKFKKVNDTYGHSVGDKVIKMMTETVKNNMIEGSILGRIGGEEFALLCHVSNEEEIVKNLEEIRLAVEMCKVEIDNKITINFTISGGMAKSSKDTNTLDLLLKKADKAMYEAKDTGRNKAIFR